MNPRCGCGPPGMGLGGARRRGGGARGHSKRCPRELFSFISRERLWLPHCHKTNRTESYVSQSLQLVSRILDSSFISLTVARFFPWEVRGQVPPPSRPLVLMTLCWHAQADDTLQPPFMCDICSRWPCGVPAASPLPPDYPSDSRVLHPHPRRAS